MKRAAVIAGLATVLVLAALPLEVAAKSAKCKAGTKSTKSGTLRTFCGKAAVKFTTPDGNGKYRGGACQKTKKYFTINIGALYLGPTTAKKHPNYFGLTVGKTALTGGKPAPKDGTYAGGYLSIEYKNTLFYSHTTSVTLKANRTKGTFTAMLVGGVFGASGTVSGSFSCK